MRKRNHIAVLIALAMGSCSGAYFPKGEALSSFDKLGVEGRELAEDGTVLFTENIHRGSAYTGSISFGYSDEQPDKGTFNVGPNAISAERIKTLTLSDNLSQASYKFTIKGRSIYFQGVISSTIKSNPGSGLLTMKGTDKSRTTTLTLLSANSAYAGKFTAGNVNLQIESVAPVKTPIPTGFKISIGKRLMAFIDITGNGEVFIRKNMSDEEKEAVLICALPLLLI